MAIRPRGGQPKLSTSRRRRRSTALTKNSAPTGHSSADTTELNDRNRPAGDFESAETRTAPVTPVTNGAINKAIGVEIRRLRKAAGLTQRALAEKVQCHDKLSSTTVMNYERGSSAVPYDHLIGISRELGTTAPEIIQIATNVPTTQVENWHFSQKSPDPGATAVSIIGCFVEELIRRYVLGDSVDTLASHSGLSTTCIRQILMEARGMLNPIVKKHHPQPSPTISVQQNRVLQLIAEGRTTPEIAAELGLSYLTIKAHTQYLLKRLDVNNRVQAVMLGIQSGILSCPCPNCYLQGDEI